MTHQKMFSVCIPHAAACVHEIKFSDSLRSYASVFSKEPYDCSLDVFCDVWYSCDLTATYLAA